MSFKHMNIILDLDNTIISAEETDKFNFKKNKNKTLKFSFHNMDDYYIIFERPNIQVFLDFIFKNFNVSIWTAATKDYALFIIENVILKNRIKNIEKKNIKIVNSAFLFAEKSKFPTKADLEKNVYKKK